MISYSLYITEPPSRNLEEKVDPEATEAARVEDMHKIDYLMRSMVEDLSDLLPGWTIELSKEER